MTLTSRTGTPRDIQIRYQHVDEADAAAEARALRTLSPEERARASRFLFARDRTTFVVAHALLRDALSEHAKVPPAAWTFSRGAQGKPTLAGEYAHLDLAFNLSHTHGLVACAIRRGGEVGIDVERLRDDLRPMELAARFFASSELASLEACADDARAMRFIELWTLKESYVKAIGEGLSHPLDQCRFMFHGPSTMRFEAPAAEPDAWQFALFAPSARHRMAVGFRTAPGELVEIAVRNQHAATAPILVAATARRQSEAPSR